MGTFLTVLYVICAVGVIYRVISGAWTGQKSYLLDGTEVKIPKSQAKHTEAAEASEPPRPAASAATAEASQPAEASESSQPPRPAKPVDVIFDILAKLGCQPERKVIDDKEAIIASYQGANFEFRFNGNWATVYFPFWTFVLADDPNLPLLREAINQANYHEGPTILWTPPHPDGRIYLHSAFQFYINLDFPDNESMLISILCSFFDKIEHLRHIIHNLSEQQAQNN